MGACRCIEGAVEGRPCEDVLKLVQIFVAAWQYRAKALGHAGLSTMLLDDLGRASRIANCILLLLWRRAAGTELLAAATLVLSVLRSRTWPQQFQDLSFILDAELLDVE